MAPVCTGSWPRLHRPIPCRRVRNVLISGQRNRSYRCDVCGKRTFVTDWRAPSYGRQRRFRWF